MTKDDIISMALDSYGAMTGTGSILFTLNGSLVRFAELLEAKVRADERNACAALCSEVAAGRDAEAIEEAILARGNK